MKISFSIAALLFIGYSFGQVKEIDSLKKALPSLNDTNRIDCLNALSFQYIRVLQRDSAEYYQKTAFHEAEGLNYIHGIAESVSNLSGIFEYFDNDFVVSERLARESISWFNKTSNHQGIDNVNENLFFDLFAQSKYDEAYKLASQIYRKSQINKDLLSMHNALIALGVIHYQKGNYDSSFYFFQLEQQLAVASRNNVWLSSDLISFGSLYRAIGDYYTALGNYRRVFLTDTKETIQDRMDNSSETWTRMEFAELFALTNQFDSSWHYYNLFDTTKVTDKDLRVYLVSTGETYMLQKNYEKALPNLIRGLAMHRKLNDRNEIKRVLLDIAKTYFALNNDRQALQYAQEGLEMAMQTKSRQFIRDAYLVFYFVYDRLHQNDSAYFYYQKYIDIKDVVVSEQTKGKFAAYKYEERLQLLNAEKELQQQQIKQASLVRIVLLISIAVIILLGIIIVRNTSLKRKNEEHRREIAEAELQKEKLENKIAEAKFQNQKTDLEMEALRAQMNPHFIFNSLNSINRFILQNNKTEASAYLTKFSRLVRMILQNSQVPLISLENELEALSLYLELEALRFNFHFTYKISYPDDLDISIIKVPPLIIQPFVENAIWHGLMHKKDQGQLEITVKEEEELLLFRIYDNGVGRKQSALFSSKSSMKHKSMGLRITTERIAMLKKISAIEASVTINDLVHPDESAAGTEVILKIPTLYDESHTY